MRHIIPPWMLIVQEEYNKNTKEVTGGENPNILAYHQCTALKATDDETPWCSAFANFVMQKCSLAYKGTQSAQAISWLEWGKEIGGRYGAIAVKDNGDGTGHVTFFLCLADAEEYGYFVGGNQNNQLQISKYLLSDFVFRWPNSFAVKGGYG